MDESKGTSRAVILAAVLHLGIVGFLFLAVLSCTTYEKLFETLSLPASWNPITCPKPIELPGPIIEATLVGPTGSPPPKAVKAKPVPNTTPPPPAVPPPTPPQQEVPKVKPLPPPPEHPDVKDQEKVVEDAEQKAEAKQLQDEKERQRQAELDAQAAKQKEEKKKQLDQLFAKMDAAAAQTKQAENAKKQAQQQMKDLADAKDNGQPDLPKQAQTQTGNNGPDSLQAKYLAAIQNAVTQNWLRPDNMPNTACVVHIVQIPGGNVMSAKVDPSCPYDDAGRRSIENAVLRAQPLPYQGFESVFQRTIDFTFRPQ